MGNLYYYYKTKDDIVGTVVSTRIGDFKTMIGALEDRHRTPAARLKALFKELSSQADLLARYGCPYGTLCSELRKQAQGPDPAVAQLMQVSIDWAERQFREMGRRDAHGLAIQMIGAYQGAAVLTHALASPDLMRAEARRIDRWIDSLRK